MAVVRYVPDNGHWRLEYPVGKVLLDGINWISTPRISPDGKWIAFVDHENPSGDDEGSIAIIDLDGHEKKLASGYVSLEGIVWSPKGDEVWFTGTQHGNATDPQAVSLGGKLRTITNVPGGMWLQDIRNEQALVVTQQIRIRIRGMAPGGKQEQELGWLGWSIFGDITNDGKKILFSEEADGGGPNYTVFLRDTSGAPPMRIGEGNAVALSPDAKWAITKPKDKGILMLVPTGAGEARQLTHDNVTYVAARYLPDGQHLLAIGVEAGHRYRTYLIDVATGDSKPITPEGISGTFASPDGRLLVVRSQGEFGIWSLETNSMKKVPGLDPKARLRGWSADSKSLYVALPASPDLHTVDMSKVEVESGKITPWKSFGNGVVSASVVAPPLVVDDGNAYVYIYTQRLSEAYVVKGLR
jgi:eukaryotic-like serine/threonine-protein kinase